MNRQMMARFDAAIDPFMRKLELMDRGVEKFQQRTRIGFQDVEERTKRTASALSVLRSSAIALGSSAVLMGFKALSDAATVMRNQMEAIGLTTDEARNGIYRLAIETRTPIEATTALLVRMQKSLPGQDIERTIRQVATLNRLLLAGGADSNARASVSLQFSQALQSGVLQGDELRSLREAAPRELLEAIAKAAGGTVAQLKDLGSQSKLTTEVMVKALEDMEAESIRRFGGMKMSLGEAAQAVRTGMLAMMGGINEGSRIGEDMAGVMQRLAGWMVENADAGEELGRALRIVAEAALVLAGARGVGLLSTALTAQIGKMTALRKAAGLTGVALSGLRSLMMLFGGPVGLAFAATTTAIIAITNANKSFKDSLTDVESAVQRMDELPQKYGEVTDEIEADLVRLRNAQDDVAEAIRNQATAAEETARREVAAIEERIAKNRELARSMLGLGMADQQNAEQGVEDMRRSMVRDFGGLTWQQSLSPFMTGNRINETREANFAAFVTEVDRKVAAGDELTQQERDYLVRHAELLEKEAQAVAASKKVDMLREMMTLPSIPEGDTGDGNVMEQVAAQLQAKADELQQNIDAMLSDYDEAREKLTKLEAQKAQIQSDLADAVAQGNQAAAARLTVALVETDEAIRKIEKDVKPPADQLRDMLGQVGDLREELADMPVDESQAARAALTEIENKLIEAIAKGEELNAADFGQLVLSFQGVRDVIDGVLTAFNDLKAAGGDGAAFSTGPSSRRGPVQVRNASYAAAADRGILDLIGAAEGTDRGRGYNETLGYGAFTGGDVNLTGMTLNEVMALQQRMLAHPDNRFNSSALGRYQITRQNLSTYLMPQLGLTGDELFDETMQDRMAMQLLRKRNGQGLGGLRNEWEGLRRVDDGLINEAIGNTSLPSVDEEVRQRNLDLLEEQRDTRKEYNETLEDTASRHELEMSLIGKSAAEQARLTVQYELTNDAKRRGIDLDEVAAGSNQTYREQIAARAEEAAELVRLEEARAAAMDRVRERQEFSLQIQQDMRSAILDLVTGTNDWADALKNVGKAIERALWQAALFNDGPFGGIGGSSGGAWGETGGGILGKGGLLGTITGAIFGSNETPSVAGKLANPTMPDLGVLDTITKQEMRLVVEEGPMFASRVRKISADTSVEVVRESKLADQKVEIEQHNARNRNQRIRN